MLRLTFVSPDQTAVLSAACVAPIAYHQLRASVPTRDPSAMAWFLLSPPVLSNPPNGISTITALRRDTCRAIKLEYVCAFSTINDISTTTAYKCVIATATDQRVVACTTHKRVRELRTGDNLN